MEITKNLINFLRCADPPLEDPRGEAPIYCYCDHCGDEIYTYETRYDFTDGSSVHEDCLMSYMEKLYKVVPCI